MLIGTISFKIRIPYAHSLKEKRRVLKSLIAKLQNKFKLSVAEIDQQDQWQSATIGIALVGSETKILNQQISWVIEFLNGQTEFEVLDVETSIF